MHLLEAHGRRCECVAVAPCKRGEVSVCSATYVIDSVLHSKSRDTPTWVREDDANGLGRIARLDGVPLVDTTWNAKAVSRTASAILFKSFNAIAKRKFDIKRCKCTISFPCSDTPHWPWLPQL